MKDVNPTFSRNGGEVRRDRELRARAVGVPVRALCGLVAAGMLALAIWMLVVGNEFKWLGAALVTLIATPFAALAAFGWRVPVIDPVASKRFRELADPARPLTADDFRSTSAETERDTA